MGLIYGHNLLDYYCLLYRHLRNLNRKAIYLGHTVLCCIRIKLLKNTKVSHFRVVLTPGIDFLGKNTSEMVCIFHFFDNNFFWIL